MTFFLYRIISENLFLLIFFVVFILVVQYMFMPPRGSPPGPINLPIVGYLPFLDVKRPYLTLTNLAKRYGPIYVLDMGFVKTVVLSDEKIIREALCRDDFSGRAPLYITHGIMQGYGLICAEGMLWKDQRGLTASWLRTLGMVKFGSSRQPMEHRVELGIAEAFRILDAGGDVGLNPVHMLHHSVGTIVNKLVFGITWPEDHETWIYLQQLQEEGVKHIGVSGVVNFFPWLRFWPSNKKNINFLIDGKLKTHAIYDMIIANHKVKLQLKERQLSNTNQVNFEHIHDPKFEQMVKDVENGKYIDKDWFNLDTECILDCFLKERMKRSGSMGKQGLEYCSDEQLRHLLADIFGAGVDTTVTTLRWFLLFMACESDVQRKIQEELDDVVGTERRVSIDDRPNLKYLAAALLETQRIRSVVPLGIPHGAMQNAELFGYKIPYGSMIIPLQWAVHMDPENWENPEVFNPDRFISETGQYKRVTNFIPFQSGKRMCVGDELGRILLFMFASVLLQRYHVTLTKESDMIPRDKLLEGECGITLTPPEHELVFLKRSQINF